MKTVGILGIGPQSTIELEVLIHEAAQENLAPNANSGYPPMVVYHHRRPPVALNENGKPIIPLQPDPEFLDASAWIGARSDLVVIAANGPHIFASEVREASGCEMISMIDVTIDEVRRRQWGRVGVLAFFDHEAPVYTRPLRELDIHCENIDADMQKDLDAAILRVMEGRETDVHRDVARNAIAALRAKDVDGIIPGCTEIPLLLQDGANAPYLVHPSSLLARAIVEACV